MELNNIYNSDCLEGMKEIVPGTIDLILCDLPCGTTRNKWDSMIPLEVERADAGTGGNGIGGMRKADDVDVPR